MPCPACGARLVTKTSDRPPRLICARCGGLLPQTQQPSLLGLIDRHAFALLIVLVLISLPMLLLAFAPWLGNAPRSRGDGRSLPQASRWDPRSGVVGRSR